MEGGAFGSAPWVYRGFGVWGCRGLGFGVEGIRGLGVYGFRLWG